MKKMLLVFLYFFNMIICGQTATLPAGAGTIGDPYQIASLENLYWIAATDLGVGSPSYETRLAAHYIQIADINASTTSSWFSNAGWLPIGNVQLGKYFTGIFNGQGHTIDGLSINRSATNYIGLFSGLSGSGIIKNVGLTNVNITGSTSVGALVGYNIGATTINNCYSKGSVTNTANDVGGLVGHCYSGPNINNCYSTVNVIGINNVGGFVGTNESSTIINCYSMGNASGNAYIGGLVGVNTLTITNCYSTGKPSGSTYVGGLVGYNGSSVNNCFWDKETSELTSSAGGTGKTTTEMKTLTTFTNATWDFVGESGNGTSDYWNISGTKNSGYPYLNWQTFASVTFTDGSVFSQSLTNGSSNQAIGRFSLNGSLAGGSLNTVIIKLNGTRSGASNFKLWLSTDNIFDGSDTQIGSTVAADPGEGNTVTFSSLSSSIGTNAGYFFLTCDLTAGADGTIQPIIVDNNALTLSNADLTGTITNSTLAGSTSPLPVELISFSAEVVVSSVLLKWQTATEINNYGFEVEKKKLNEVKSVYQRIKSDLPGGDDWEMIGFVDGNGNSNSVKEYSFIDKSVTSGKYSYRLKQIDTDGNFTYSDIAKVEVIPTKLELFQNYPNPFNPTTTIKYSLPSPSQGEGSGVRLVTLKVYDILGNEATTLVNENQAPGNYEVNFDASKLSSGVYLYKLSTSSFTSVKKLLLLK